MNIGVIFAGGIGQRMKTTKRPKQFLEMHGKPIIIYTLEIFEQHPEIDAVVVACVQDWIPYLEELLVRFHITKVKKVVPGGDTGQMSIYNGLAAAKEVAGDEKSVVLIHDGVRPLINEKIISDCIAGVKKYGSAVTVAPAIETIIKTDEQNIITETFLRSDCQLARAPQSFFLRDIVCAHEQAKSKGIYDFVDSTSLMLHFGYKIHTIEGPSENIKVTNPADFYICRALLDAKENSQIYGI